MTNSNNKFTQQNFLWIYFYIFIFYEMISFNILLSPWEKGLNNSKDVDSRKEAFRAVKIVMSTRKFSKFTDFRSNRFQYI